jgi:predicted O-methyltransferase YrrM
MKANLVVGRCGDNSLHPHWLAGAEPNFDLVVTYYGDQVPGEWLDRGYAVVPIKGPKWKGLHEYLTSNSQWRQYQRILLPDDDLLFDAALLNRFFDLAARYGADLSQPALDEKSYFSHPITLVSQGFDCRVTSFVEIMCPCLSTRFLELALPFFSESSSGFGLEFLWTRMLLESNLKLPMIFDGTAITHTRPVGGGNRGLGNEVDPFEEMKTLFATHNLPYLQKVTFAGVLKSGEILGGTTDAGTLALRLVRDALAQNKRMSQDLFASFIESITEDPGHAFPWLADGHAEAIRNWLEACAGKIRSPDRNDLVGRTFRFFRIDGSFIGIVTLAPHGTVSGYQNANEKFWSVENGSLVFANVDHVVTTVFDQIHSANPPYAFSGPFLAQGPGTWHCLAEVAPAPPGGVYGQLLSSLYGTEGPYTGAAPRYRDEGYPHTNLIPEVVASVLDVVRPRFWLELGSMLGGSAIRVADAVKSGSHATQIVCVDPFTGDVNMWAWEQPKKTAGEWQFLRLERGKPTIYDRFLANVAAAGHADVILPIAATSIVGLKLLRRLANESRLSLLPSVIYLDSAHEPDETFLELQNCWALLEPGGVLMGDDWSWDSVRNDVLKFARTVRMNSGVCQQLMQRHQRFTQVEGILLDRGQWLLAK